MSLTLHLDDSKSPVRLFMTSKFPNTAPICHAINPQLKALNQPRLEGYEYGTVGTAFDYRARYYFAITPYDQFVAYNGAAQLFLDKKFKRKFTDGFFSNLTKFVEKVQPHRRTLSDHEEEELARYCVALALLEQRFRVGPRLYDGHSVLWTIDQKENDTQALLCAAKPEWIEDLVSLSHGFRDSQRELFTQDATLNPIFDGSCDVGGADADLIVNHCLIEIKTGIRGEVTRNILYQLIGYALLDYSDEFAINALAIYWARQRYLVKWALPDLLREVTGQPHVALSTLRSQFRAAIPVVEEVWLKRLEVKQKGIRVR